jgi:hypothetical protein
MLHRFSQSLTGPAGPLVGYERKAASLEILTPLTRFHQHTPLWNLCPLPAWSIRPDGLREVWPVTLNIVEAELLLT